MHLLFPTHCTGTDYYGDCDFYLLEIDASVLEQMTRRLELAQQVNKTDGACCFCSMDFFFYHGHFISDLNIEPLVGEQESELLLHDNVIEIEALPEGFTPEPERTELDMMTVYKDQIHFSCIPKHTDITVETVMISQEQIEQWKKTNQTAKGKSK